MKKLKNFYNAFLTGFSSVGLFPRSKFVMQDMSLEHSFGKTWNSFRVTSNSLQKGIEYARQ
ncbi:MAG: hypothetical protein LBB36_04050 [Fibromonadaceae bacterium]|nr:hypothetical protein [Fibromonadaceae bacterium]